MRNVGSFQRNVVARRIDGATRILHSSESWGDLFTKNLFVDIGRSKQEFANFGSRSPSALLERVRHNSIPQTVRDHVHVSRTECRKFVKQLVELWHRKLSHLFIPKIAARAPSGGPTKKQWKPAEGQIMRKLRCP